MYTVPNYNNYIELYCSCSITVVIALAVCSGRSNSIPSFESFKFVFVRHRHLRLATFSFVCTYTCNNTTTNYTVRSAIVNIDPYFFSYNIYIEHIFFYTRMYFLRQLLQAENERHWYLSRKINEAYVYLLKWRQYWRGVTRGGSGWQFKFLLLSLFLNYGKAI